MLLLCFVVFVVVVVVLIIILLLLISKDLLGIDDKVMKRLDKIIIDHGRQDSAFQATSETQNEECRDKDDCSDQSDDDQDVRLNANSNKPVDSSPVHEGSPMTKNIIFKYVFQFKE